MSKSKFSLIAAKLFRSPWFWGVVLLLIVVGLRLFSEIRAIHASPLSSWDKEVNADCAVVLTGGPGRVREGFDLLADRHVKKLIISGVHPDARLRDLMPNWTFHHGLKDENVVLEKRSETTWGNAQQSLPIVEALRCRDIVLVTSRTHMRRAFRTFRAAFPETISIQTQAVVGTRYEPTATETLVEALKSLFYSLWAY